MPLGVEPGALSTRIAELVHVLPELPAQMIQCWLALDPRVRLQCQLETCSERHAAVASRFAEHMISRASLLQRLTAELTALHNRLKAGLFPAIT